MRPGLRCARTRVCAAALFLCLVFQPTVGLAQAPVLGELRGTVIVTTAGVSLATLGPTAVYLEALDAPAPLDPPELRGRIAQRDAHFDPDFLVVSVGQVVEMPNLDPFYHNVFSYSRPNEFDLGMYTENDTVSVTFERAGIVRIYCSIHESMRAVIVVSSSPWHARVDRQGRFRITGISTGRYRLHTFNERLPDHTQLVTVDTGIGEPIQVEIGTAAVGDVGAP